MLTDLVDSTLEKNPDMVAEIYGPLLTGGLKLRLTAVEYYDEVTINRWKKVCWQHGFVATTGYTTGAGYVTLICRPVERISQLTVCIVGLLVLFVTHLYYQQSEYVNA